VNVRCEQEDVECECEEKRCEDVELINPQWYTFRWQAVQNRILGLCTWMNMLISCQVTTS